jgi:hypothetical protein
MGGKVSDGALGIFQAAWETPLTPTLSIPITDWNWGYVPQNFKSSRVRSNLAMNETRLGFYNYELTVETELTASGLDILLKSLFGGYAFAADTPVAGANTHTHTLADIAAEKTVIFERGFTFEAGSDGKWYTFDSCVVNTLSIATPKPGMITASWGLLARDKSEDVTGETYAPSSTDKVFDNFQVTVAAGVAASEVTQPIETFTLDFSRGITPKNESGSGEKSARKWVPGTSIEITGAFTIATDATEETAVEDDLLNSDEASLIATFTSDIAVTGSTYYTSTITIPEFKYTGQNPSVDNSDRVREFTFELGQSSGDTPITWANINDDATL